jgi:hypothetical protein
MDKKQRKIAEASCLGLGNRVLYGQNSRKLLISSLLKKRVKKIILNADICEYPCGRDRRTSEIEYLFSVSFPLVGNPSNTESFREKILDSSA